MVMNSNPWKKKTKQHGSYGFSSNSLKHDSRLQYSLPSLKRQSKLRIWGSQGLWKSQRTREERAAQRAPEMSKVFPLKSSKHLKNLPRQKEELPGLPWWSSGQDFMLSMQGMQVWFPVRELTSHMPHGQKHKLKNE